MQLPRPDLKKLFLPDVPLRDEGPDNWKLNKQKLLEWCDKLFANIEKLEQEAILVYAGEPGSLWTEVSTLRLRHNKQTWIFPSLIEPIKRGVTKQEMIDYLRGLIGDESSKELADRIEAEEF